MTKTIEIEVTNFDVAKWWKHGESMGRLGIGVPFAFARRCCFLA